MFRMVAQVSGYLRKGNEGGGGRPIWSPFILVQVSSFMGRCDSLSDADVWARYKKQLAGLCCAV